MVQLFKPWAKINTVHRRKNIRNTHQVDPSKSYDRLARIFYDAIEERIAIHEHEDKGQQRDSYDEIALYQKVSCFHSLNYQLVS